MRALACHSFLIVETRGAAIRVRHAPLKSRFETLIKYVALPTFYIEKRCAYTTSCVLSDRSIKTLALVCPRGSRRASRRSIVRFSTPKIEFSQVFHQVSSFGKSVRTNFVRLFKTISAMYFIWSGAEVYFRPFLGPTYRISTNIDF